MEHGFAAGDSLPKDVLSYTRGVGADRVLICASTPSNAVIEQAVEMARDRGRVVIVGAVGMDVPHAPFYQKELDLVISRSYGPGRYDPLYEEKGIDYPVGYVRWTERRNMEEFLRLVQLRKVDVGRLITHEFGLEQLEEAYSLLLERPSECLAVLLRYPEGVEASKRKVVLRAESAPPSVAVRKGNPRVAVIGCGAFARQFHLPNLKRMAGVELRALVASSAQSSREFGERYGAAYCSTDWEAVLKDGDVDAVLVFTRDRSHARIASAALEAGKHVFCEKPLATSYEDCQLLAEALRGRSLVCTVGFNRRFAPLVVRAKETLRGRTRPCVLSYRVNAGSLPADSWIYDADHSAGRVVGEVCHFVDLCAYLIESEPVAVFAQALTPAASQVRLEDVLITLTFADGSAATVLYTAAGSSAYGKERLEFFADGSVVVLDDFRSLTVRGRKRLDVRDRRGDKGHAAEIEHFGRVLRGEETAKVNAVDGLRAAVVCLKVLESVESGERVDVDLAEYA
jgi:predicted dehydrogenase